MPDIVIRNLKDSAFSHEDVIELIHLSFKEREAQGLHFSCSSMSGEEFAADTKSGKTFVAVDSDSGQLVGTASVRVYDKAGKKKYGLFEYLAVHPEAARRGIASKLLDTCIRSCQEDGGIDILSDTATPARSSVRFHFKNGFRLDDIVSYPMTNYLSFVFRRECVRSSSQIQRDRYLWKLRYMGAYLRLGLLYKKDGGRTWFSRMYNKLMAVIK